MWTLHPQQQQRGAQLHARGRRPHQPRGAPEAAFAGREAQEHDRAAEDVGGAPARPGESPASRIEDRDGDPASGRPARGTQASWDAVVQPERRRGPAWDDEPLPEGK